MTTGNVSFRVWVGQIAKQTNVDDIKSAFQQYGKIVDFKFIPKKYDSFAFIEYSNEEEAERAMKMGDGMKVGGSKLKVNSATPIRDEPTNDRKEFNTRSSFYGDEETSNNRRNRSRSRSRERERRERKKMYKVEIQNLPRDMTWQELKRLGSDYGKSLEYTRVWEEKDSACGMLEFSEKRDATKVIDSLNGKRMEDSDRRLKVFLDDSDDEVVRRRASSPRRNDDNRDRHRR